MKIFTKIMLVILFSTFCVCSSAQNSQGNGLQQYEATNNNSLTIELIEAHISCNGLCDGSIGTLVYGTGPFTYKWSNGSESSSISDLCAGNYSVVVKSQSGEIALAEVTIKEPNSITGEVLVTSQSLYVGCNGAIEITNVTGGNPPYTYLWSTGFRGASYLGICDGLHIVKISDTKDCSTKINIELTNTKDCSDMNSDNGNFAFFCKPRALQENNIESKIYPNPSSHKATLEFSVKQSGSLKIQLHDSQGALLSPIFNQEVRNDIMYKVYFNSNELKSGLYYYQIITDDANQRKSFVVLH